MQSITLGESKTKEIVVTEDQTALNVGSGGLNVFATPAMIALMENCAWDMTEQFMDHGESTVGVSIEVKHLKASAVGEKIKCSTTITSVEGRKIGYEIAAIDSKGDTVGTATHSRFMIVIDKFMSRL